MTHTNKQPFLDLSRVGVVGLRGFVLGLSFLLLRFIKLKLLAAERQSISTVLHLQGTALTRPAPPQSVWLL